MLGIPVKKMIIGSVIVGTAAAGEFVLLWNRGEPLPALDRLPSLVHERVTSQIVADVQAVLMTSTRAEWLELFAEKKIPSGPINRIDQLVADEALTERGLFYCLADDDRRIPQVGPGVQVDGAYSIARSAPPRLGQHTESVLAELLGYAPARLAALRAAKTMYRSLP